MIEEFNYQVTRANEEWDDGLGLSPVSSESLSNLRHARRLLRFLSYDPLLGYGWWPPTDPVEPGDIWGGKIPQDRCDVFFLWAVNWPFYRGENKTGFVAKLGWITKEKQIMEILHRGDPFPRIQAMLQAQKRR